MPITIERKKDLLRTVSDIGRPLTTLEMDLRIEGIGEDQIRQLRHALEVVRSLIATQPERVN